MKMQNIEKVLDEAEVIDKEKESLLSRISDWMFDHIPGYAPIWRFVHNHLTPRTIRLKIKRFFQRRMWGFDDVECYCLDWSFYQWLLPRLKRFEQITGGYPDKYKSFEQWKRILKKRIEQLELIVKVDEFDCTEWSYLRDDELKSLKKKKYNDSIINCYAYYACIEDFLRWFSKDCQHLWY